MNNIEFEDFQKIELRVGKIIEAEKVPKSNKLLKFLVDLGEEKRVIVSGVAKYYDCLDMIDKEVVVVTNLKPREIFGIESNGMILFAHNNDNLLVISPEQDICPGSIIS